MSRRRFRSQHIVGFFLLGFGMGALSLYILQNERTSASNTTTTCKPCEAPIEVGNVATHDTKGKWLCTEAGTTLASIRKHGKAPTFKYPTKWVNSENFYDSTEEAHSCSHDFRSDLMFLHPGKAGGGTVDFIAYNQAHVLYGDCHPHPCKDSVWQDFIDAPLPEKRRVMITIRDPVDRFVSSFNWRAFLFCRGGRGRSYDDSPDMHVNATLDTRITVGPETDNNGLNIEQPETYCRRWNVTDSGSEPYMVKFAYNSDVNGLAEGFCASEQDGAVRWRIQSAYDDARMLIHGQHTLVAWLGSYYEKREVAEETDARASVIYPSDLPQVLGIAMERLNAQSYEIEADLSFETRVERAVESIVQQTYETAFSPILLEDRAPWRKSSSFSEKELDEYRTKRSHSTAAHGGKPPPLKEYGACCLTRYFLAEDYALIAALVNVEMRDLNYVLDLAEPLSKICQWGQHGVDESICIASLRSMLGRRSKYLSNWDKTCHELVGGGNE